MTVAFTLTPGYECILSLEGSSAVYVCVHVCRCMYMFVQPNAVAERDNKPCCAHRLSDRGRVLFVLVEWVGRVVMMEVRILSRCCSKYWWLQFGDVHLLRLISVDLTLVIGVAEPRDTKVTKCLLCHLSCVTRLLALRGL